MTEKTAIQTMEQTIRDRRHYELEHRVVHPDGTIKFVHTIGHPVFQAHRAILVEVVGTSTDITERKRGGLSEGPRCPARLPDVVAIIRRGLPISAGQTPTYERVLENTGRKGHRDACRRTSFGREMFDRVVKTEFGSMLRGRRGPALQNGSIIPVVANTGLWTYSPLRPRNRSGWTTR